MSCPADALNIRPLRQHEEFAAAVSLQREIWGFEDVELLPLRLFVVADKIGGQVLGAFDGPKMVAFCLCIPGLKPVAPQTEVSGERRLSDDGMFYLHSHMLGVMPEYRNTGLGRRLKWKQREYALAQKVKLVEWTFDPLEIKNAFFNMERLGAIARRYTHNQYGTTSSHLHGGLPTDRLTAEWWIATERVEAFAERRPFQRPIAEAEIVVPSSISDLRQRQPEEAREIQRSVAEQFDKHFADGLAVIGFELTPEAGTYLLGSWESR